MRFYKIVLDARLSWDMSVPEDAVPASNSPSLPTSPSEPSSNNTSPPDEADAESDIENTLATQLQGVASSSIEPTSSVMINLKKFPRTTLFFTNPKNRRTDDTSEE